MFTVYIVLFLVTLFVLGLVIKPLETASLRSTPQPVTNYTESLRRIEEKNAVLESGVVEYGQTIILTHGQKTEHVAVLYHGYTNCPRQYEELAKRYFEQGYNVYVPRIPHHGIGDLLTKEIGRLTIEELMDVCDTSIDIAQGLGEKVTVLGLSMGGVMAAWNAQFREDIDLAVVIVPSFGWYFLPGVVNPLANMAFLLPNAYLWWDPIKKDKRQAPYSMYHRFSTRGMGHILRLGLSVLRAAKRQAPRSKRIVVMTNNLDMAVDEKNTQKLVRDWTRHGAEVRWYHFKKDLQMEHDVIDPLHTYAKIDFVYDKIFEYQ